jgi:quinol monooxygenase YgiN
MLVRFFFSAVDPADRDEIGRIFVEDVKPAFDAQEGCLAVELLVSPDQNVGGLLEGVLVSRWRSDTDIEAALVSRDIAESLVRVRQLLRVEPVIHNYVMVSDQ